MSKPLMTTIPVRDAVGTVLCQDITRIEPSKSKGPVFRKGHFICQLVWWPFFLLFLSVSSQGSWIDGLLLVFSVDFGLAVLGSLLGTFAIGREGRDALLTVLCFPLLLPLLLGAINLGETFLNGGGQQSAWWGLIFAFDALFTGAALLLFPFAYTGE